MIAFLTFLVFRLTLLDMVATYQQRKDEIERQKYLEMDANNLHIVVIQAKQNPNPTGVVRKNVVN